MYYYHWTTLTITTSTQTFFYKGCRADGEEACIKCISSRNYSPQNLHKLKKENIKINAYETSVEISSNDEQRKYHKIIDLPPEANIETVKSKYNNGILEVIFNKKIQTKPKGKEVKVE